MPYEIRHDSDSDCLLCRVTGVLDMQVTREVASEINTFVEKHRCHRVLSDLRKARLKLSTMDLYGVPKVAADAGYGQTSRRAMVFNALPDDLRFFEDASVNKGQHIKLFTDYEAAKQWLLAD